MEGIGALSKRPTKRSLNSTICRYIQKVLPMNQEVGSYQILNLPRLGPWEPLE